MHVELPAVDDELTEHGWQPVMSGDGEYVFGAQFSHDVVNTSLLRYFPGAHCMHMCDKITGDTDANNRNSLITF